MHEKFKPKNSFVVCLLPLLKHFSKATQQTLIDLAFSCRDIKSKFFYVNSAKDLLYFFAKNTRKIIVAPYPAILTPIVGSAKRFMFCYSYLSIIAKLKALKRNILILYVYDLPIEQNIATGSLFNLHFSRKIERKILNLTDAILVYNESCKENCGRHYNICQKIKLFDLLDYGRNLNIPSLKEIIETKTADFSKINIYLGANFNNQRLAEWVRRFLDDCLQKLDHKIVFHLVGKGSKEFCRKIGEISGVKCIEELSNQEYVLTLATKAHFGLVPKTSWYNEFGTTSKFSSYMVSGTPVLVPSYYCYLSQVVERYNVGLIFNDCNDLVSKVTSIDIQDYKKLVKNAYDLGLKLRYGFFFKKALCEALIDIKPNIF